MPTDDANNLLTLEEAQKLFPAWSRFFTLSQRGSTEEAEERMEQALRDAEGELRDYVQIGGPEELTPRLKRYLVRLLKYEAFQLKHSTEDYESKPTVVRRYESAIATLEAIRDGTQPDPRDLAEEEAEESPDVRVFAKPRRFDESWLESY